MKTFCPNCEKETECEFTAELYECKECGEDFAKYVVGRKGAPDFDTASKDEIDQYLRERGYDPDRLGVRGKLLTDALIDAMMLRELLERFMADPGGCRFCDYGVLRKPNDPAKGHDEDCVWLNARAYLDAKTSTIVKRELSDAEIEEMGARSAEEKEKHPHLKRNDYCWSAFKTSWAAPAVNKRYLVMLENDWICCATYYLRVGGGYWKNDSGQEINTVVCWRSLDELR